MRAVSNYAWKMSEGCERKGGGGGWVDGGMKGEVRTAEDFVLPPLSARRRLAL